jgi:hypothetical protein
MSQIEIGRYGDSVSPRCQPRGAIAGHDPERIGDRERVLAFPGAFCFDAGQLEIRLRLSAEKEPLAFAADPQPFDNPRSGC